MVANAKSRNPRGVSGNNIDSGTMDTAKRDERVIMGRIRGAHGVRGLLRVQPFSAQRDTLLAFKNWMLGGGDDWRDIALVSGHAHGSELLVKLDGVEDRDRAQELGVVGYAGKIQRPLNLCAQGLVGIRV